MVFGHRIFPILLVLASTCIAADWAYAADSKKHKKVASAINSIRGHDVRRLSQPETEKLDVRLDRAWNVLRKYPKVSRELAEELLDGPTRDDFLRIDLSHLLLFLDDDSLTPARIPTWLSDVNPGVYPSGYFWVAAITAAEDCESCLPLAVRLAQLDRLDVAIGEHAMLIDLEMGLLFVLGQYGDSAVAPLAKLLEADDCTVRRNAAYALKLLLPNVTPPELRTIALYDDCLAARNEAWRSLKNLEDSLLPDLVARRLRATPPAEEKLVLIDVMSNTYIWERHDLLVELSADEDEAVSHAAEAALEKRAKTRTETNNLIENLGSGDVAVRTETVTALNEAIAGGYFDFEGSAFELEAGLTTTDLTLLNDARASVLGRLSDECLYEWKKLYLAATLVRVAASLE